MTDGERWSDLVAQMYCLVREQAPLHEVTGRVVDLLPDGDVAHGPWEPAECRSVLAGWHRAGWLELVADAHPPHGLLGASWRERASLDGSYLVLATPDAAALLHDPARWRIDTAEGHAMLCLSDEGSRHEHAEWSALVERPAEDDVEGPVPLSWRPTFSAVVDSIVARAPSIGGDLPGVDPVPAEVREQCLAAVRDYGQVTLAPLPPETWTTSVAAWQGDHWLCLIDLWTEEEGRSDLVLRAEVREHAHGFRFTVVMVYVP